MALSTACWIVSGLVCCAAAGYGKMKRTIVLMSVIEKLYRCALGMNWHPIELKFYYRIT
jgi:hypothetical protein